VDRLYVSLLGRNPGGGEDQGWINALASGSINEEQALGLFLTSEEYYDRVTQGSDNPNGAWVQSLYMNLFGRQDTGTAVNAWINAIPQIGLSGVVHLFLTGTEFRTGQVEAFYGAGSVGVIPAPDILKRPTLPSADAVSGWVNSGLDLRNIEVQLLASTEFATRG
jgi:hypothetical protein